MHSLTIGLVAASGALLCIAAQDARAASGEEVEIDMIVPAAYPEVPKRASIIVFDLAEHETSDGAEGAAFADALRTRLQAARINDEPVYTIRATSATSIYDVQAALDIGAVEGVDAVYIGTLSLASPEEQYTEKRTECLDDRDITDLFRSCENEREKQITCFRRNATYEVALAVVDVQTKDVIYQNLKSRSEQASYCEGDNPEELGGLENRLRSALQGEEVGRDAADSLAQVLRNRLADDFRNDIAPRTERREVTLKTYERNEDKGRPRSREERDALREVSRRFDAGIEWAERGQWARACGDWSAMLDENPENVSLLYNLGVCAEAQGDLDRALRLYSQASDMLLGPDDLVIDALQRAEAARAAML